MTAEFDLWSLPPLPETIAAVYGAVWGGDRQRRKAQSLAQMEIKTTGELFIVD